jgi:restriction system protein
MKSLEAVYQVLSEERKPLHIREITNRILTQKLWNTKGKTPAATLVSNLIRDIREHGGSSRFYRAGKNIFGLKNVSGDTQPAFSNNDIKSVIVKQSAQKMMSFLDAAEFILKGQTAKIPLHYKEITERALQSGLLTTAGRTPEMTMYAQILGDIKRMARRGEKSRFIKCGRSLVGLAQWESNGLVYQIEEHNRKVHQELLEHIGKMAPAEFEALVGRLLTAIGFELVSVTPISNDGGIDVRGTLVVGDSIKIRMAVQAKRWKSNVPTPVIQQVRGSLGAHEQGLIITSSNFSTGARKEAERPDATPVALMSGEQLINLLIENDILVRRTGYDLIELGEEE